jgi:hypothetical protein
MQFVSAAAVTAAVVFSTSALSAAAQVTGQAASPTPATQGAPAPANPSPGSPPASAGQTQPPAAPPVVGVPSAPATGPARAFTAPVGLLFNTVRPERAADFEKAIAYVKAALEKSTDPDVQAQARGWRMYKAAEPGPNSTILYVFVIDPTVPGADYGLGRILAETYPDMAQLQEIWKLYTGSVTGGGSLLNLTPIVPPAIDLTAPITPPPTPTQTAPPRTSPIDTNPNVPGGPGR